MVYGLSSEELIRIAETTERRFFEDHFDAIGPDLAQEFGAFRRTLADGSSLFACKASASGLYNRVLGLGLSAPATQETLDGIAATFEEFSKTGIVALCPMAEPSTVGELLLQRGFRKGMNWVKMIRKPVPPQKIETDLRIEPLSEENAAAFGQLVIDVFGVEDFFAGWYADWALTCENVHTYLALDGDTPVATGTLVVANGVGGFVVGATLPSHRGRGAQGALMAHRIAEGIRLGCEWLITETGEEQPGTKNSSYRNMLRCGFELAYVRPNYIYEP